MTDIEKEFIIEQLKALAGIKKGLEKLIVPNTQTKNEGAYIFVCQKCLEKIKGREMAQTWESISGLLCSCCMKKNEKWF